MRRIAASCLIAFFSFGAFCSMSGQDKKKSDEGLARGILENALVAHGGRDKCAQLAKSYSKRKGKMEGTVDYVLEQWNELPSRSKTVMRMEEKGQKGEFVQVIDGKLGWIKIDDGGFKPVTPEGVSKRREALYRDFLRLLYPILEQRNRFTVRYAGEASVEGRATQWISVTADAEPDMDLFFDKETKLLVKLAHSVKGSADAKAASLRFSDYKEAHGVWVPHRITTYADSRVIMEDSLLELRPVAEFPKGTFTQASEEHNKSAEKNRARDLLTKAVAAHGGREKIAQLEKCYTRARGRIVGGQYFAVEKWMELPIRFKCSQQGEKNDQGGPLINSIEIVNGETGWLRSPDKTDVFKKRRESRLRNKQRRQRGWSKRRGSRRDDRSEFACVGALLSKQWFAPPPSVSCRGRCHVRSCDEQSWV